MAHLCNITARFSGGQGTKQFANWSILAVLFVQCLLLLVPIPCSLWLEPFKALDLHFHLLQVTLASYTHACAHHLVYHRKMIYMKKIKENILEGRNYDSKTR